MVVEIRSNLSRIGTALRAQILERVEGAVGRSSETVLRVHVGLSDENGPRGGVDKRCRIHVHGKHGDVVVEDRGESLESAIFLATSRLKRTLRKTLERQQEPTFSTIRRQGAPAFG
jgi:putative sigma-54 modulation protein